MRQVREVLRLTTTGVGLNEIARRVGVAPSTVRLTLKRLASAGLNPRKPPLCADLELQRTWPPTIGVILGGPMCPAASRTWCAMTFGR